MLVKLGFSLSVHYFEKMVNRGKKREKKKERKEGKKKG